MFAPFREEGVWDSWVERWRDLRGISLWPIVKARVEYREWTPNSEGNSCTVTVSYQVDEKPYEKTFICSVGSGADTPVGEELELRAKPGDPQKVVFADTKDSSSGLAIAIVILTFILVLLAFHRK